MGVTNYLLNGMILQVPPSKLILFPAGTFEFFIFLLPFGGVCDRFLGGYFGGIKQGWHVQIQEVYQRTKECKNGSLTLVPILAITGPYS